MRTLPSGDADGRAPDADLGARLTTIRTRRTTRRRPTIARPIRLTAQIGSIVATLGRLNAGGGPIQPDPVLSHAANFLYMLTGERPSGLATRAFDVALDPARRPRAERLDVRRPRGGGDAHRHSLGGRRGDRHAQGSAARRRQRRRDADAARDRPRRARRARPRRSFARKLARKEKIPGFGHRVYKTAEDPRATHLRQMSRDLGQRSGQSGWFEMSERIEALVKAEKHLNPNVDFYSASTYHALGIDQQSLHADFRRQPDLGLDRARPGAVREQPADPPARRLHRPRVSAALRAGREQR